LLQILAGASRVSYIATMEADMGYERVSSVKLTEAICKSAKPNTITREPRGSRWQGMELWAGLHKKTFKMQHPKTGAYINLGRWGEAGTGMTLDEARVEYAKAMGRIAQGDPARAADNGLPTLGAYYEKQWKPAKTKAGARRALKAGSTDAYRHFFARIAAAEYDGRALGSLRLDEITVQVCTDAHVAIRNAVHRGSKARYSGYAMADQSVSHLRDILNHAARRYPELRVPDFTGFEWYEDGTTTRDREFSREDIVAICAELDARVTRLHNQPDRATTINRLLMYKAVLSVLLNRDGEIRLARWKDEQQLDGRRVFYIPPQDGVKDPRGTMITVTPPLAAILARVVRIEGNEYVFASAHADGPVHYNYSEWREVQIAAGIDPGKLLRFHDTRRTARSIIEDDEDSVVGLGQVNKGTLEPYTVKRLKARRRVALADKVAEHITSAPAPSERIAELEAELARLRGNVVCSA
jgi:hypothetical protein